VEDVKMKITVKGTDFVIINEQNLDELFDRAEQKIHLIKLYFDEPTKEKILSVVNTFTKTNRYVISNNIKIYNDILKTTGKKYYIENEKNTNLISYLRKNNKILLNFNNLRQNELDLLLDEKILLDLLRNVEVIKIKQDTYDKYNNIFNSWDGNIILSEDE
jgi:hypothetical protein